MNPQHEGTTHSETCGAAATQQRNGDSGIVILLTEQKE